jgi:hypothetical protein
MEIIGEQKHLFYTLLITIKNYDALLKYYRKSDAIGVEKEASQMIKESVKKRSLSHFIGYFSSNQFVLISNSSFDEMLIQEIESNAIHYINSTREVDLHLAYKTKEISFKAKIPLAQMEEILNNEFDLLH